MNEVLYMFGTIGVTVLVIGKMIALNAMSAAEKTDDQIFVITFVGIVICLFGGLKAIKMLITFSVEETDAVRLS